MTSVSEHSVHNQILTPEYVVKRMLEKDNELFLSGRLSEFELGAGKILLHADTHNLVAHNPHKGRWESVDPKDVQPGMKLAIACVPISPYPDHSMCDNEVEKSTIKLGPIEDFVYEGNDVAIQTRRGFYTSVLCWETMEEEYWKNKWSYGVAEKCVENSKHPYYISNVDQNDLIKLSKNGGGKLHCAIYDVVDEQMLQTDCITVGKIEVIEANDIGVYIETKNSIFFSIDFREIYQKISTAHMQERDSRDERGLI